MIARPARGEVWWCERDSDDPIPLASVVNLDAVESVSIGTLVERLGRVGDDRMNEICEALEIAVDCER